MARIAFYNPGTWALRQQVAVTGVNTGRGLYFDGVSFWVINELATIPATWEIAQCQITAAGGVNRVFGFPFTAAPLTAFETLTDVTGITGDGMNLYISYEIETVISEDPPAILTQTIRLLAFSFSSASDDWISRSSTSPICSSYN